MARQRLIKPEFWTNDQLAECSFGARLLFIGLLNFADDNGLMQKRFKKIKMSIFSGDNVNVENFIKELSDWELIKIYKVDGQEYIWIINFSRHQRIDRPSYVYPIPDSSTLEKYSYTLDSSGKIKYQKKEHNESKSDRQQFDDHSSNDLRTLDEQSKNFVQDKLREDKLREDNPKEIFISRLIENGFKGNNMEHEREAGLLFDRLISDYPKVDYISVTNRYASANKKGLRNHVMKIQAIFEDLEKERMKTNPVGYKAKGGLF